MELPLWLVEKISGSQRKGAIVQIQKPPIFNDRSRDIFEADPKVINLYRLNPHFYEFGRHLARICPREDVIRPLLIKVSKHC